MGTTNFLTCLALDQFRQSLTGQAGPSTLEITEYRADRLEMLELSSEWRFVYSSLLRGEGDYVNEAIAKLCGQLPDLLGDKKFNIPSITDNESANLEILAGLVERAETKSLLGSMDADNYAVSARNGKLIVTAHNDDTMRMAFSLFTDILSDSVIVTEGGEKQIVLPADFTRIYTDKKTDYITDFPRPEGLALSGTINVHDGSFEYYYEGEGVNANAYDQYCKKLVSEGYVLKQGTPPVEGSIFRTYVNEAKGIMLYAAYNAFSHAQAQGVNRKSAIRLIVGHTKKAAMVPDRLLTPDFSGKIQNSSITTVIADHNGHSRLQQFK